MPATPSTCFEAHSWNRRGSPCSVEWTDFQSTCLNELLCAQNLMLVKVVACKLLLRPKSDMVASIQCHFLVVTNSPTGSSGNSLHGIVTSVPSVDF